MNGTLHHRVLRVLVSIVLAAILVLCIVSTSYAAPAAPAGGRPSNSAEQMLYDAVNRERASLGLRQLQWDTALANAARLHTTLLHTAGCNASAQTL